MFATLQLTILPSDGPKQIVSLGIDDLGFSPDLKTSFRSKLWEGPRQPVTITYDLDEPELTIDLGYLNVPADMMRGTLTAFEAKGWEVA